MNKLNKRPKKRARLEKSRSKITRKQRKSKRKSLLNLASEREAELSSTTSRTSYRRAKTIKSSFGKDLVPSKTLSWPQLSERSKNRPMKVQENPNAQKEREI